MANSNNFYKDGVLSCSYIIDSDFLESLGISVDEYEAATGITVSSLGFEFRYDTEPYGGFCLPNVKDTFEELIDVAEETLTTFYQDIVGDTGTKAMADIAVAWPVIATCAVVALILGYIFLFILAFVGAYVIYAFLLLTLVSLVAGGYYARDYALGLPEEDSYNTWIEYGGYALWVIAALFLCCICCCWGAIKVAIAVYKTTS